MLIIIPAILLLGFLLRALFRTPEKELPGLRGFSARNLRYMRTFYEEWSTLDSNSATDCDTKNYNLALVNAKTPGVSESAIWHLQVPNSNDFPADAFFEIGFTQHRTIFEKIKDRNERYFYIRRCSEQKYTVEELLSSISRDDYNHQAKLPNRILIGYREHGIDPAPLMRALKN